MKKLFALFLCAIMALSVACATAETAPEETGKLVLYSPLTTSMIENMLAMFEAIPASRPSASPWARATPFSASPPKAKIPSAIFSGPGTIGTVKNSSQYFQDYTCANEDAFHEQYRNVESNPTGLTAFLPSS